MAGYRIFVSKFHFFRFWTLARVFGLWLYQTAAVPEIDQFNPPFIELFSVFRFILRSGVAAAAAGHQGDSDKHSESDSVTQIADGASYYEVESVWVRKRVMTIKGQLWHRWSLTDFFLHQRKMFNIFILSAKKYKRLNWLLFFFYWLPN